MSKDRSALFEVIRPNQRSGRDRFRLPSWWQSKPPRQPRPKAGEEGETAEEETRAGALEGVGGWFRQRIGFRLARGTLLGLAAATFCLVLVAFFLGRMVGHDQAMALYQQEGASAASFGDYRQQAPNGELISGDVPRVDGEGAMPAATASNGGSGGAGGGSGAGDPREPGLNYFRLFEIPAATRADGRRAVRFLEENGIDAALIPVNNGRSLKLVALRGFERVATNPQAQSYADRLRMLGRKWKEEERGGRDWSDLYAEKYTPGAD